MATWRGEYSPHRFSEEKSHIRRSSSPTTCATVNLPLTPGLQEHFSFCLFEPEAQWKRKKNCPPLRVKNFTIVGFPNDSHSPPRLYMSVPRKCSKIVFCGTLRANLLRLPTHKQCSVNHAMHPAKRVRPRMLRCARHPSAAVRSQTQVDPAAK